MAGVGPAKTIPDAKNLTRSIVTTKNEKIFTKSCRFSLFKVFVAFMSLISSSCPCSFEKV
jgi:hypothetical protein